MIVRECGCHCFRVILWIPSFTIVSATMRLLGLMAISLLDGNTTIGMVTNTGLEISILTSHVAVANNYSRTHKKQSRKEFNPKAFKKSRKMLISQRHCPRGRNSQKHQDRAENCQVFHKLNLFHHTSLPFFFPKRVHSESSWDKEKH